MEVEIDHLERVRKAEMVNRRFDNLKKKEEKQKEEKQKEEKLKELA